MRDLALCGRAPKQAHDQAQLGGRQQRISIVVNAAKGRDRQGLQQAHTHLLRQGLFHDTPFTQRCKKGKGKESVA